MSIFSQTVLDGGSTSTATGYPAGTDFSTFWLDDGTQDMDPNWIPIMSGERIVLEHVLRRWLAVPGEYFDQTIGAKLFAYINQALTMMQQGALRTKLREQALMTEGVDECRVALSKDAKGVVTVKGEFVLDQYGPFLMVMQLTTAGVQQLLVQQA